MRRPVQLPLDLPHRTSLDRDDLIVAESNRLAVEAVDGWPAWPHPVLLLVGPPGSGKTHLAEAWMARSGAARLTPGGAFRVPPGAPFALAVEDIDRAGFSEETLFAALNAARLGGGALLATSRVRPVAMRLALPDLRSRLAAATTVELGAPGDELLAAVLAKLFADRQIALDPRLIGYLVERMERSLGVARHLVDCVDRETLAVKRRVSRDILRDILVEIAAERDP